MDEVISNYSTGSEERNRYCGLCYPKSHRYVNPTDASNYVYFEAPGTLYSSSSQGTRFAYATSYSPEEGNTDTYTGYATKTGTSDTYTGYSDYVFQWGFYPTDEDYALGFGDFGRRLAWYYSGRTWFSNSSPGDGYLHVACTDNDESDTQKNALLAKLDTKESNESGYMSCTSTSNPNSCPYIVNAGLTPTAGTLQSAIDYFRGTGTYSGQSPVQYWCQKNFIVYVTDGLPSVDENGTTGSADELMPEALTKLETLRSLSVDVDTESYDFDIKTYIIGLGLTDEAKAKLDSMAQYGGTDVQGRAYYADNVSELIMSLNSIFQEIIENTYKFALTSVTSSRVSDENYLYEGSFIPLTDDPFWFGHLRKFNINSDGTVGSELWDAGYVLQATDASSRTIYTAKSGALTAFTVDTMTMADLGVTTEEERATIVGYIRGEDDYNPDNWKLGDVFRSYPITIATPSEYFDDIHDENGAFATHRANHTRTSTNGLRTIIVGANDGQLHAFRADSGAERWSFIPPNLRQKLQYIVHTTHPTSQSHRYFVDGVVTAGDVWLGTGDGSAKSASDWKTLLIFGEGRGAGNYLWSSSSTCDTGYSSFYSTTYPYYGGYYCLDVTDVTSPTVKWMLSPGATDGPYLGDPWCKIMINRVSVGGNERWVGFMGAGYNAGDCTGETCDTRGKGFFIVNLTDGSILWSYTRADDTTMDYSLCAPPAVIDRDLDGFIDLAYIGDLGGNIWRFSFCEEDDGTSCDTTSWMGSLLFEASDNQPIYTSPAVSRDKSGNIWIYWGTGDKTDPLETDSQHRFFAVKDEDMTSTYTSANLDDITATLYDVSSTNNGWYITLPGAGEKVLGDPAVFGGYIYFSTFTPDATGDVCSQGGDATLYGVHYVTGAGVFADGGRTLELGAGIPAPPVISLKPGGALPPDLYSTTSGGGGIGGDTKRVDYDPPGISNRTNMLFWQDRRIQ